MLGGEGTDSSGHGTGQYVHLSSFGQSVLSAEMTDLDRKIVFFFPRGAPPRTPLGLDTPDDPSKGCFNIGLLAPPVAGAFAVPARPRVVCVSSVPPLLVVVGYWRFGAVPRAVPVVWNSIHVLQHWLHMRLVVATIFYS